MRLRLHWLTLIILWLFAAAAYADSCITSGYIFYHNGSEVPIGTPVRLTNTNTGVVYVISTTLFAGHTNRYLQDVGCIQSAGHLIQVFSWANPWNGTVTYNSQAGVSAYPRNLTYNNIPPVWNVTLPNQVMDEDNLTGISDVFNASDYCFDYDGQAITYSIGSQTNPTLVNATITNGVVDISATGANRTGSSTVCLNADDSEDATSSCFTITVNAVPDIPSFSAAADNFTGTIISNDTTIRVTTTAFDGDGQQVRLYVCDTTGVNAGGCTGTQYCTALAASNPACSWITEDDEALHTWHAFVFDTGGSQATTTYNDTYTTDSNRPSPGTATLNSGVAYSSSTTVALNWSGFTDSMSGIRYYYYSTTNGQGTRTGTQVSNTTTGVSLTLPQSMSVYYVWAEDFVGHIGLAATDSVIVDSAVPVFSGWVQNPANLDDTHTGALTATVTVTDTTLQGLPMFRYRIASGAWTGANMTDLGGGSYRLSISANWTANANSILYYEANATDYFNRTTTEAFQDEIEKTGAPPSFLGLSNLVGLEDSNISFTLLGSDPNDEDTLNFTASCCFTIVPVNNRSAAAYWMPDNDDVGTNAVRFNVTDGSYVVNASITVTVIPVNDAPVLDDVADLTGYIYEPFGALFSASDPDNRNSYLLDDNDMTFSTVPNMTWFRLYSYDNGSNHYSIVNFTPVSSNTGYSFLELLVSDGAANDSANFTLYIGYCGDTDAGGEPRCDTDYETCTSCPTDCGECGATSTSGSRMTILVKPRNCLNESFTMKAYELWGRASCEVMGTIVDGYEVCGNLSATSITVYRLEAAEWVELEEYETDDNGEATFVPSLEGEYKLVAEKRSYPNAIRYLEIRDCLRDALAEEPVEPELPPDSKPPVKEKPTTEPDEGSEIIDETGVVSLLWVIAIPAVLAIFSVTGYYFYDKEKDKNAYLLKVRIWLHMRRKKLIAWALVQWKRVKEYLGYK